MAKHGKNQADGPAAKELDGIEIGFLAEEDALDRRTLWRLASWGVGAVCAVTLGVLANQSYSHSRRDQSAAADLTRQSEQLRTIAQENRSELKRLSAAVATLNGDRDRLYARATSLEQEMQSVTGSIARQATKPAASTPLGRASAPDGASAPGDSKLSGSNIAKASDLAQTSPTPGPVSSQAAADVSVETASASRTSDPALPMETSAAAPPPSDAPRAATEARATASAQPRPEPQPAGNTQVDVAAIAPDAAASASAEPAPPEVAVPRTEFGVDLGTANSIDGLRILWRRVNASHQSILAELRPVIALRERKGTTATQLRLIAGPLVDAAAAAKICVAMAVSHHSCETTVFDGQRLAVNAEPPQVVRPAHRRPAPRRVQRETSVSHPAQPSTSPPASAAR